MVILAFFYIHCIRREAITATQINTSVTILRCTSRRYKISFQLFQVLTSACAVISIVACDRENLGVITDYGVVPHLAHLTHMVRR